MKDEYVIVDDFQVKQMRVLVLNEDYEFGRFNRVLIDGREYPFAPNSVMNWVVVESTGNFKGKVAKFIRAVKEQ